MMMMMTVFRISLTPLSRPSAFFYLLFTNISDNRSYLIYGVESVGIYIPKIMEGMSP